ncbi:hypothetical protein CCUS01_03999 [Colletotrichum cuscutae]|uniref:Uncharacterized protein n=2 Tax=Colletotrichum acutatum species complex TaxID=2707335 RepID=A0AAI9VE65_9PEZI|nr:hypothetical protein CCUS01_03999 [Colletotrichum cuscutae]
MMVSRGQKIRSHISFSQYQNSHTETSRILFRPRVIIHSGTAVPWPSLYRTTGGRLRLPVTLRSLASTTDNMLSENSDRVICSRPSVESKIHKPWNRNPDSMSSNKTGVIPLPRIWKLCQNTRSAKGNRDRASYFQVILSCLNRAIGDDSGSRVSDGMLFTVAQHYRDP